MDRGGKQGFRGRFLSVATSMVSRQEGNKDIGYLSVKVVDGDTVTNWLIGRLAMAMYEARRTIPGKLAGLQTCKAHQMIIMSRWPSPRVWFAE